MAIVIISLTVTITNYPSVFSTLCSVFPLQSIHMDVVMLIKIDAAILKLAQLSQLIGHNTPVPSHRGHHTEAITSHWLMVVIFPRLQNRTAHAISAPHKFRVFYAFFPLPTVPRPHCSEDLERSITYS